MPDQDGSLLERASGHWNGGQPLEAGRLIFDNLPKMARPEWASRILRLVLGKSRIQIPEIDYVLEIADHTTEWRNAHGAFSALRRSTLHLERLQTRSHDQDLILYHLYLAENVAKVIYNAVDPPDEFDEDSGWWVVVCLRSLVDCWSDEKFSEAAWFALCCGHE
jgi:hypothetical protein